MIDIDITAFKENRQWVFICECGEKIVLDFNPELIIDLQCANCNQKYNIIREKELV